MNDMADLNFDANNVAPNEGFAPISAGDHDVMIIAAEVKHTAAGTGKYLKLTLQVLSGQFQNRLHFENLNLWNNNAQAVQIAQGTLSAICRAIGIMTPKDSKELVDKSLTAKFVVRPKKDSQGEFENRVVKWSAKSGTAPTQTRQLEPAAAGGKPGGW